jgi:hypothetical protein
MRSSNDRLQYAQTIVCNLKNLPHTRRSSGAAGAPLGDAAASDPLANEAESLKQLSSDALMQCGL